MIRFAARFLGYCLVAIGFANLVIDGTMSIASGVLRLNSVGSVLDQVTPDRLADLQAASDRAFGPAIWSNLAPPVLAVPAFVALTLTGLVFVLLGRRPRAKIGFEPLQ